MFDYRVYKLAEIYLKFYKTLSFKHFTMKSFHNSRWKKFFVQAIEKFADRKEWNDYLFIATQFEKHGIVYPSMLAHDSAWKTYLEYKDRFNISELKGILSDMLSTYNFIKKTKLDFKEFLKTPKYQFLLKNKRIDYKFFLLYKPFYKIIDPYELDNKWITYYIVIRNNLKIYDRFKKLFKGNIISNLGEVYDLRRIKKMQKM